MSEAMNLDITALPGFAEPERDGGAAANDAPKEDARSRRGWTGWLISLTLHALLILLMSSVYWLLKEPDTETPPVRVATIDPPPAKKDQPKAERELEAKVELDVAVEADVPSPITALELPVEVSEREEQSENPNPKGREEAVADSEMGGSGAFMAVGAGGGSAGMFGNRTGGGKKRAIGRGGGSKGSESAVDAALRWLKRHQDPRGCWDAVSYPINCTDGARCEPGSYFTEWYGDQETTSVALTGYGVLCFLGAGYDHMTPNKHKATVRKGLEWLVSNQHPNGRFGKTNYENAIATMALCEAYAMTGDPALKAPAQKGVDVILANQCHDTAAAAAKDVTAPAVAAGSYADAPGLGWDYCASTMRNDSSVTGWNVMALKSAVAAGLNVGRGMEGARHWLERVYRVANPGWKSLDPYQGRASMPYTYSSETGAVTFLDPADPINKALDHNGGINLSCVGMVCAVFLGHHSGDPMLTTLANEVVAAQIPKAYPCNTYYMYYNTLGMFQVGGEAWKTWNGQVRDMLVKAQRTGEGCFDGSWDSGGTVFYGSAIGRVLSTEYCCLCLEVYYRYAQVAGVKH
jgi:hypothetical protein